MSAMGLGRVRMVPGLDRHLHVVANADRVLLIDSIFRAFGKQGGLAQVRHQFPAEAIRHAIGHPDPSR
jgi:hypothetical protein